MEAWNKSAFFDRDPWLFNCANGTIDLRADPQPKMIRLYCVLPRDNSASRDWSVPGPRAPADHAAPPWPLFDRIQALPRYDCPAGADFANSAAHTDTRASSAQLEIRHLLCFQDHTYRTEPLRSSATWDCCALACCSQKFRLSVVDLSWHLRTEPVSKLRFG